MTSRKLTFAAAVAGAALAQTPVPPVAPAPPNPPSVRPFQRDRITRTGDRQYDQGRSAMDSGKWEEARKIFDSVAAAKGKRADAALYWRAYAENRLGRRSEAQATLSALRQQYPQSEWLNDAQALTLEIQQQSGKPADPNAEADEDMKLIAIGALSGSDPERAVPLLENILKSNASPKLKDKALFVLTQTRSPRAQQVLSGIAKGGGNPDLQLRALNYMAISGSKNSPEILAIYQASKNPAIRKQAINSLMIARGVEELYGIAKSEQDAELRGEAIRMLGVMHQPEKLAALYQAGIAKETIIESMFMTGDSARVLELARTEKDPKLRAAAIRSLGLIHSDKSGEALAGLYAGEQDATVKKKIIEALFIQHNAKSLVDIGRKETNVELKREIVQKLALMHTKEASDFMLEILK